MAILKNPYLSINAVNLSAYVREVSLTYELETPDNTVGNANSAKSVEAGLKSWRITGKFKQVYDTGYVDATLAAAHGTEVAIELRPDAAAVGTTNPKYTTSTGLVLYRSPFSGAVGSLQQADFEILPAGTGVLTRATA